MSYAPCPNCTGMSREVVKWMQNLELSLHAKNVRRDFSNGYMVAQICWCYFPKDFPDYAFDRETSLTAKQRNWSHIEKSLKKHSLFLTKEVVDGTIHCKPGAAELLLEEVHSILTKRRSRETQESELDFTDGPYQERLPAMARSTATKAIKNNLRMSEIMATPDFRTNQRKAELILHMHEESRAREKVRNPGRFKVKPKRSRMFLNLQNENPSFGGTSTKSMWSRAPYFLHGEQPASARHMIPD